MWGGHYTSEHISETRYWIPDYKLMTQLLLLLISAGADHILQPHVGVLVSARIAVPSPFPTDCATRAARMRHTMLDLSVGAMSALRDINAVGWVFAPLTKNRVQPTPLWSARRPAS